MPDAIHFDPETIAVVVSGPRASFDRGELERHTRAISAMADDVDARWGLISKEQQRLLIASFAPRTSRTRSAGHAFLAWLLTPIDILAGWIYGVAARNELEHAISRLADAVKNADDLDNPEHRARTAVALQATLDGRQSRSPMTTGQFSDWLSRIPDRPK